MCIRDRHCPDGDVTQDMMLLERALSVTLVRVVLTVHLAVAEGGQWQVLLLRTAVETVSTGSLITPIPTIVNQVTHLTV